MNRNRRRRLVPARSAAPSPSRPHFAWEPTLRISRRAQTRYSSAAPSPCAPEMAFRTPPPIFLQRSRTPPPALQFFAIPSPDFSKAPPAPRDVPPSIPTRPAPRPTPPSARVSPPQLATSNPPPPPLRPTNNVGAPNSARALLQIAEAIPPAALPPLCALPAPLAPCSHQTSSPARQIPPAASLTHTASPELLYRSRNALRRSQYACHPRDFFSSQQSYSPENSSAAHL